MARVAAAAQTGAMNHERREVIDGELVDAPRALADIPARPVEIRCATHPAWLGCGLTWADCVQHAVPVEEPDTRTWTERARTFRVVDRRRARY